VEIHAFALMDNHFHILAKQIKENGISNFMNKLGGYSYYFNKKYKRVGPLFQGRFKAILVRTDEQLKNVFVYINTNPVGLIEPGWKENGIKDFGKIKQFLKDYKWSSYVNYIADKNSSSLINKDFFLELYGGDSGCESEIESWLRYKIEIGKFANVMLE
jgi:putative transposase